LVDKSFLKNIGLKIVLKNGKKNFFLNNYFFLITLVNFTGGDAVELINSDFSLVIVCRVLPSIEFIPFNTDRSKFI